uniref:Reverse transcriptase n=1 Tax=Schistosoma japonicum TaxID=6182 RepID=C7C210_SCHJA|nr:reverse transcriptase [Schistosoma japonicum]
MSYIHSAPKFCKYFRSFLDEDTYKIFCNRIKLSKKMCNWYNHRIFNLRCLNQQTYPRTILIKSPDNSIRSIKAAVTATRTFLRERIHRSTMNLESLRSRITNIDDILSFIIPTEIRTSVNDFFQHKEYFYNQSSKKRQIRKFEQMLKHTVKQNNQKQNKNNSKSLDLNKVVVNLSDRILNEQEISLLRKGLNFNMNRSRLSVFDVIPTIDSALNKLPEDQANIVRNKISSTLLHQKPNNCNMSKNEIYALKQLRKEKTVIITRADKGNTTVVMNTSDYNNKASQHLNEGPYEKIKATKCRATLNNLKAETSRVLRSIKSKLGQSLWFSLAPKSCSPCRFYGLPKIHKMNVPLRPVVDYTNSPTYNLAKYLAGILKHYDKEAKYGIKNAFDFKNMITNMRLEEDEIMASFDVCSLFTNVHINNSLDIINEYLLADNDLSIRCPLEPSEIIKCLSLCLNSTLFKFRGDLYKQTEGVAMGSPVSPIVANLFMHSLETNALSKCVYPPKLWLRYVDDTFIITKRDALDELFENVNSISNKIKFTKEIETADHKLSFLDCLIERKQDNYLKINIFRKPTYSGKYLDYKSAHAKSTKVTVVGNLINRIHQLVTDNEDKETELNLVMSTLMMNNYPKNFIKKILKEKRYGKAKQKVQPKEWIDTVVVPYRNGTSEEIRRILNKHAIRVFFRTNNTLGSALVNIKDRVPKEEQTNCVYEIKCNDCSAKYVGETSRQLNVRMKEHKLCLKHISQFSTDILKLENKSAIALHSIESGHSIDFDGIKILQKGFNSYKERLTSEALHIWANPNNINRRDGVLLAASWQLMV